MVKMKITKAPTESFLKDAPIGPFVRDQIIQFRAMERLLPKEQQSGFREKDFVSQDEATRYLTYMMEVFQGRRPEKVIPMAAFRTLPGSVRKTVPARPSRISRPGPLAASAEDKSAQKQ